MQSALSVFPSLAKLKRAISSEEVHTAHQRKFTHLSPTTINIFILSLYLFNRTELDFSFAIIYLPAAQMHLILILVLILVANLRFLIK